MFITKRLRNQQEKLPQAHTKSYTRDISSKAHLLDNEFIFKIVILKSELCLDSLTPEHTKTEIIRTTSAVKLY